MDFRQLEAFCAIVEWGNFSEASRHLYISQPTVSSHIQALENTLNVQLINRNTKPVSITDEGKRFYEYASSLLRLREKAVREFSSPAADMISIGVSSIPSAYILPEIMAEYKKISAESVFDVIQSDSSGIIERLLSGSVDIGITGAELNDERYCCKSICRDEMVLAMPANSYYKRLMDENMPVETLLKEPYILRESGSGTRRESEMFLESIGFSGKNLNVTARINDLEGIKMSIAKGLGVSILSQKVTKDMEKNGQIIVCPLRKDGVYRNYYLIYRKNISRDRLVLKFIRFIEKYYDNEE